MEMNMSFLTRTAAASADETNVSTGGTLAGPGLAAHGYDVVAFFADGSPTVGSDKFALAHKGGTYRFASQANLDAFKASPDKYLPAYGGFCAYGTALGKKLDGDPRVWKIVDGTLYFNLNPDIAVAWAKDIPGNIAKANANWSRIRGIGAAKL
jgi:YHS domain-containing protein